MILDVFQKGLIRGSARLPFDPEKAYAYVEHPREGWRVYLRSCIFLHSLDEPFRKQNFLVVKRMGARPTSATWEPPKGQMEGKEWEDTVLDSLAANVLRETEEESHITEVKRLRHTGLVFQSQEADYPPNHFFQYHIFQGFLTLEQVKQSIDTFDWMKDHKAAVKRWRRDRKEKDAVAWFSLRHTRVEPKWCPDIVALYLRH